MKKIFSLIFCALIILGFSNIAFAQKLVIIYTAQAHANLYPCRCPIEPFGGVARRVTKLKELRKAYPDLLLLDAGSFFAGGIYDDPTPDKDLQESRTKLYLQTLKIMGYDGLNVGVDEFNFGKDFLESQINSAKIPFLSCNAKLKEAREFIIKEINGIKIGIIGLTPILENIPDPQISPAQTSVQESIKKLKAKNADLIIVLSALGEEKDLELIKNIPGIDFLISGGVALTTDKFTKLDGTILLRPAWQARKLGKLEIDLKDKRIESFNVELISLGADVPDDAQIKPLIPVCFSNYDCAKPNFVGTCKNAGLPNASCAFEEIKRLSLLVIKPKNCRTCYTNFALNNIKRYIPNIEITYADYEEQSYRKLIDSFGITMLPAYILTSEVEKDRNFSRVKEFLDKKDSYYFFKPYFSGVSYFLGRQVKKNALDLFILLHDKQSGKVLQTLKAFKNKLAKKVNLNIHFLIIEDVAKGFISPGGLPEIEEAKRSVCVMKYYPGSIWDYLICRTKDAESSWWEKCSAPLKINVEKIRLCATAAEADNLLRQNIKLNQELQVTDTPLILMDNQEVFGITSETTVEELEGIIKDRLIK